MRRFLTLIMAGIMIFTMAFGLTACKDKEGSEGMPNPMTEYTSLEEINEIVGCNLCHPAVMGISDEKFFTIDCVDYTIAEYRFTLNGTPFVFRCASVSEDISGVYVDEGTIFSDTDESGVVNVGNETFAARWFTIDGQYCLVVNDTENITIESFEVIAEELESLTSGALDAAALYEALAGEYQDSMSGRAMMTVVNNGGDLGLEIQWSDSAAAYVKWTMNASLSEDGLLYYGDCEKAYVTMTENADGTYSETAETEYTGGTGYFAPAKEDGVQKIYWSGAEEEDCRECVFEKLEFVTPQ